MTTIKDIANKLNISISTVSKGLNGASDISDEMRQLVLDTAKEMNYKVRSKEKFTRKKICIFIENVDYESIDQFGYELIVGFRQAATNNNYEVAIVPTTLKLQSTHIYDEYMKKNHFTAGFFIGFTLHDDWVSQLTKTTIPTVLFDNYIEGNANVGYVGTDNIEAFYLGVGHLVDLGHKDIAFLNGAPNSMISQNRHSAFIKSLSRFQIAIRDDLIVYGDYSFEKAKINAEILIKRGATAIMCGSDVIAAGAIAKIAKMGLRTPDDISIVGFDDLPMASQLIPSLTTIRQDRIELGKCAFLVLSGLINHLPISKMLLRPGFVERESTTKLENL